MNKKLLIIVATHGDENLGVEVIKNLSDENLFDYIIGNPEAFNKKKRFIDKDLNRVYPGKKKSLFYEERQAYFNLKIARRYQYVIDIHEAKHCSDDFIIIANNKLNSFPIYSINLKKVVFWPVPEGTIGHFINNSIELEFGTKDCFEKKVALATKILKNLKKIKKNKEKKNFFFVYDKLEEKPENNFQAPLNDFQEIKINDETFYPLLSGQYNKEKIICYKMKKMIME